MLDRKALKRKAKKALKLNYIACLAVCFIMVFLAGEYSTTIQGIAAWDSHNVADLRYTPEQKKEIIADMVKYGLTAEMTSQKWDVDDVDAVLKWEQAYRKFGLEALNSKEVTFFGTTGDISNIETMLNAFDITRTAKQRLDTYVNGSMWQKLVQGAMSYFDRLTKTSSYKFTFVASIVSMFSQKKTMEDTLLFFGNFIVALLSAFFVTNILMVCERRFFLESRTYSKTKVGRMGFLFRERTLHPAKTMFVKDIFLTLWTFTVAGYFVKKYSYAMVPFICAENPNIKTKKAITLSREMMNGYKWELFKVDFSMFGWTLLSMITLGLVGVLVSNPYKTALTTEVYIQLRREAIEKKYLYAEELNDKFLDLDLLEETIRKNAKYNGKNPDVATAGAVFSIVVPDGENDEFVPDEETKKEVRV